MPKIPRYLEGWSVLVVDDEEDSLDVARRLLKKAGARVIAASNGAEALHCINTNKIDFILSDLSMPDMDGWLLMHELNRDRRFADTPVIALTAHAMRGDRERAIKAGFVNYITKPLDVEKFIQQLVAILVDIPAFEGRISEYMTLDVSAETKPAEPKPAEPQSTAAGKPSAIATNGEKPANADSVAASTGDTKKPDEQVAHHTADQSAK